MSDARASGPADNRRINLFCIAADQGRTALFALLRAAFDVLTGMNAGIGVNVPSSAGLARRLIG